MVSNFEIRSRYTVTGQKKSCGSLSSQERGKKLKNCVLLNHSRSFKFGYQGPQVVWPSSLTRVKDQSQKHWVSCLLWSFSCLGMQLDRGGRAKIYDLRNNTERYGEDIYIYIERDRERERDLWYVECRSDRRALRLKHFWKRSMLVFGGCFPSARKPLAVSYVAGDRLDPHGVVGHAMCWHGRNEKR